MNTFADAHIEDAYMLDAADYARAEEMIAEGMDYGRVLNYLRGWAMDYAHERYCDGMAAADFEDRAYGRRD